MNTTTKASRMILSPSVESFIEKQGIDVMDLASVVAYPTDSWMSENKKAGNKAHVAVQKGQWFGAVFYITDGVAFVCHVQSTQRLYRQRRSLADGNRSLSGGSNKKKTISTQGEFKQALKKKGLVWSQGKTHGKIHDPARPELGYVVAGLTPSDHRAFKASSSEIRRKLGVSI